MRHPARITLACALLAAGCIDSKTPTDSSATGVILSGVVVDEAGSPRGGATVSCQGVRVVTTDMGPVGSFAIGGLQPGRTTVSLGQAGAAAPVNIETDLSPGRNELRLTLPRYHGSPASVSGVVTQAGRALPGATVMIAGGTATTGPDGTFRLSGVESGYWGLSVVWSGYQEWDDALSLAPGANVVNVVVP